MDVVTPAGSLVEGCARLPQQQRQRGTVDRLVKTWEARERFQLGAEQQCTACEAVVERSFSHAVSGQGERAVAAVPHPEGEHAYSDFERLRHAPSLDGLQQDLGIRMPAPANVAFRLQRRAHRCMVVDLAVERDGETPARGMHGLMSGGRKIEDGEAAMRERDAGCLILPQPRIVGASMGETVRHCSGCGGQLLGRHPHRKVPCTRDPAHGRQCTHVLSIPTRPGQLSDAPTSRCPISSRLE